MKSGSGTQQKQQQGKTPAHSTAKMVPASPAISDSSSTIDAPDSSPGGSPLSTPSQDRITKQILQSDALLQKFQVILQKALDKTSKQNHG